MIIDFDIELKDLEKHIGWIGVDLKIKELSKEKDWLIHKFEKDPKEWINNRLNELEKDITLFKNVLGMWAMIYKKMEYLKFKFTENAEDFNLISRYKQTIDDQSMIIENDQEIFEQISELMLLKFQDKDFIDSLNKIKNISNKYYLTLKKKLSE